MMQGLTEEQRLFAEMGDGFVNELVAASRMYRDDPGSAWSRLCALGLPTALVPESKGGYDGGAVESFIIGWIQGRGLPDTPLIPSAVTSASLLSAAPASPLRDRLLASLVDGADGLAFAHHERAVDAAPANLWLKARLSPSGAQYELDGEKVCVLGGSLANGLLVSALLGDGLAVLHVPASANGVETVSQRLVDGRSAARVRFRGVSVQSDQILARGDFDLDGIRKAENHTTVALVGEAVGALQRALELASDHISTREQFGGPLSRFQVLRHRIADIFMTVREIEALGLRAARAIDREMDDGCKLLRAAKIHLGLSGVKAAEQCVQLHGAMGITEEVDVGRCLKRLVTIDCLFGNARQHLELATEALTRELTEV